MYSVNDYRALPVEALPDPFKKSPEQRPWAELNRKAKNGTVYIINRGPHLAAFSVGKMRFSITE
ncbi:hypothetical protein GCM10025791_42570 [Halioxenophilus aromaticivorans]|uniref:Uncharacterized protein n=1 Tax=Halioxenophilus aromaticivorans TaxID=1306992 RepID=A0AAV3U852_9ALTE